MVDGTRMQSYTYSPGVIIAMLVSSVYNLRELATFIRIFLWQISL